MEKIQNYIGGEFFDAESGQWLENTNPATGKVYSLIPDSDANDVEKAVRAAQSAFPSWAATPAKIRSETMLHISNLIEHKLDELALAESIDNGKPFWLAKAVDIPRARDNFSFFATAILHEQSEAFLTDNIALNYTFRSPVGLAGCISPWNLPLYLFTWKIAPALAAGNCVIAKPSEITPMTAYLLSKICEDAGLPAGVLNIVHGLGPKVGAAITAHPAIPAISFTGGTKTGQEIARTAAPMFKKLSLELGGKNPNLIFADCDFEQALKTTVQSSFSNQGQICLCGSRILIERPIYEKFRDTLVEKTSRLKIGDPLSDDTRVGAVASKQHMDKVLSYIRLAEEEGGRILTGGKAFNPGGENSEGYFISPTIIEGLSHICRTNQEEIFGPVVTLTPFDTEEEALEMANSTPYGLSATIWTQNLSRAHRVAQSVHSGIIWVNCWLLRDLRTLFGGMKQSGMGREGGYEALHFFTEPKNICIKY
jgi:aminomuconate-semialdehyde/2-hydroxymuconate-6-semialdehyde dehydrogenase